uniref:Uncharacterized protein n=1 Tax=Siphoviridae sp. ctoMB99 TaxID=2826459 RepID=A0A8S5N0J9_9CAUD|nr:MAG TPA: hypothetical protein [Siphoviridae sp. ctoMB99]
MVTKQYVDANGGETEVVIQDDEPTVDFKIWIDTNDNTYGGDTVAIAGGGTGANTSAGARGNLVVPQKPKLLWEGSLTSGSITVPGFSDYEIFAVQLYASLVLARVSSDGYLSVGEFDISTQYAGWATLSGAVMSVSEDTLTLLHNFYVSVHDTNWYQSAADSANIWITAIYGLVRKDDLQGE